LTIPHDVKGGKGVSTVAGGKMAETPRLAAWRRVKRAVWGWRQGLIDRTPPWVRRTFGPVFWYVDMLLIDHGILRLIYVNRHRVGDRAWRSAQPAPRHIRALKRKGLRTIVNLRGERLCGSYWLEQAVCERKGITLINFQIRSRAAPTPDEIRRHASCSAHRVSNAHALQVRRRPGRLMSALYRYFQEGAPVAEAKRELALR
jgi:hypothetical protein